MVDIKREFLSNCLEEMKPLFSKHWLEVAAYQDKIGLAPDYTRYISLENADMVRCYTIRDEGRLIGYWVFFVTAHMHYKADKFAINDIVYVEPEYRLPGVTPAAFQFVEEQLRAEGCSVITYHMKTYKPFESMLKGLGYDHLEHQYGKYIKD